MTAVTVESTDLKLVSGSFAEPSGEENWGYARCILRDSPFSWNLLDLLTEFTPDGKYGIGAYNNRGEFWKNELSGCYTRPEEGSEEIKSVVLPLFASVLSNGS